MASFRASYHDADWHEYEKEFIGVMEGALGATLRDFAERVRRDAVRNIQMGARSSKYPQTGNLADSIRYSVRGKVVDFTIGNEDTPYARLQDDLNPTPIWPSHSRTLNFFFYRTGRPMQRRTVIRKGNNYFGRAWTANLDVLQAIFDQKISMEASKTTRAAQSGSGKRYYSVRDARGRFAKQIGDA